MERQSETRVDGVAARTPRVEAEMAAARRMMQDPRTDAERALDTAVERLVSEISAHRAGSQSRSDPAKAPQASVMVRARAIGSEKKAQT